MPRRSCKLHIPYVSWVAGAITSSEGSLTGCLALQLIPLICANSRLMQSSDGLSMEKDTVQFVWNKLQEKCDRNLAEISSFVNPCLLLFSTNLHMVLISNLQNIFYDPSLASFAGHSFAQQKIFPGFMALSGAWNGENPFLKSPEFVGIGTHFCLWLRKLYTFCHILLLHYISSFKPSTCVECLTRQQQLHKTLVQT